MKPVINMTTRKNRDKNQIIININFNQNSLSIFLKTINYQIKMTSDKTHTQEKYNCTSLVKNMGLSSMRIDNKESIIKKEKGKVLKSVGFLKELM